jgi:hypothetical protein
MGSAATIKGRQAMASEILNRTASASGKFPTFDGPADATAFLTDDFWAVAWFSAIGLMLSLGLLYATLGTGLDLTMGAVPIETTML